jgi:malate synthase
VDVALQYLSNWLSGNGAAAIHNLMEDAATAEISRAQVWLWIRHQARMDDGVPVTRELYQLIRDTEREKLARAGLPKLDEAAALLDRLILNDDFIEFLTIPAYEAL